MSKAARIGEVERKPIGQVTITIFEVEGTMPTIQVDASPGIDREDLLLLLERVTAQCKEGMK